MMTMVEISLSDELVFRARREGLLCNAAIQQLLEDAIRRRAGRTCWTRRGTSTRPVFPRWRWRQSTPR